MTTKFLDTKKQIALSELYCRGVSHESKRFWTIFLSAPKAPAQMRKFYFYCRLTVSDLFPPSKKISEKFSALTLSETPIRSWTSAPSGQGRPRKKNSIFLCSERCPKDPAVLKILRVVDLLLGGGQTCNN